MINSFLGERPMSVIKRCGVDYPGPTGGYRGALTLPSEAVSTLKIEAIRRVRHDEPYSRTHESSGWTISGMLKEDWYAWVNEFEATHPQYGKVWGDFEDSVEASSEAAFAHFYEHHEPEAWDYGDI